MSAAIARIYVQETDRVLIPARTPRSIIAAALKPSNRTFVQFMFGLRFNG